MKISKALIAIVLMGMLLGSSFVTTEEVRAWDATVSVNPTSITEGEKAMFTVTVQNTGDRYMKITQIWIHFDWEAEGRGHNLPNVPQGLEGGESYESTIVVPIPEGISSNTYHEITIKVYAIQYNSLTGVNYPTSNIYTTHVFVESSSSQSDSGLSISGASSDNCSPLFIYVSAIEAIGLISLISFMMYEKKKRLRKKRKKNTGHP